MYSLDEFDSGEYPGVLSPMSNPAPSHDARHEGETACVVLGAASFGLLWAGLHFLVESKGFLRLAADANGGSASLVALATLLLGMLLAACAMLYHGRTFSANNAPYRTTLQFAALALPLSGSALMAGQELATGMATRTALLATGSLLLGIGSALVVRIWLSASVRQPLYTTLLQTIGGGIAGQLAELALWQCPPAAATALGGGLLTLAGILAGNRARLHDGAVVEEVDHIAAHGREEPPRKVSISMLRPHHMLRFLRVCIARNRHVGVICSVPVLCLALSYFTNGVNWTNNMGTTDPVLPASIALYAVLFAMLLLRGNTLAEHRLSFVAFRICLPLLACLALVMKLVPLEVISMGLYLDIMRMTFLLAPPLAASLVVYATDKRHHDTGQRTLAHMLVLLCLAELTGIAVGSATYNVHRVILGVVTAAYIIYAVVSLGKNIVDYSRPPDADASPSLNPADLDSRCEQLGILHALSPREQDVLKELARGHSSSYIATAFCISGNTVRSHMKRIYKKLRIASREELLRMIWEDQTKIADSEMA